MGRISSGGMMFKAITTVAALVIATSAMAQDDLTMQPCKGRNHQSCV